MKGKEMRWALCEAAEMLSCGASEQELDKIAGLMAAIATLADACMDEATAKAALIAIAATAREAADQLDDTGRIVRMAAERIDEALREPEAAEVESKQDIADALVPALRLTRAGDNVEKIVVLNTGIAEVYRADGSTLPVNIQCDSGVAMIIDICKALM